MKFKYKLILALSAFSLVLISTTLPTGHAVEAGLASKNDSAEASANRFANQIFDGMNEAARENLEMNKHCQRHPDSVECEQRRVAQLRDVQNSLQMLNMLSNSQVANDRSASRIDDLKELNQMCSEDPNSFICKFIGNAIENAINR